MRRLPGGSPALYPLRLEMLRSILRLLALDRAPRFWRDRRFWLALGAGAVVLGIMALRFGAPPDAIEVWSGRFLALALFQPLIEELLFRGLIQGRLRARAWGRRSLLGLSHANAATSIAFAAIHLVHHPPLWACAVLVPSLLFGYFRDRHGSVLPAMALHVAFNSGSFLLMGMA